MRFILHNQWDQLPETANTLFSECEQQSLFLSRIWFENLTTHALADNQSVLLACVVEDNHFMAILPLLKHSEGNVSALSTNFTTTYSLLLADSPAKDAILTCLVNGLSQLSTQPIQLEPIDTADEDFISLRQRLELHDFQSHPYFRFYNWVHPLSGQSFDEYMADRPSNLRNTIRRKKSKLKQENGYDIHLYIDNDIEQALTDYQAVYLSSWKTSEFYSDFTPALVKALSQKGWMRLAILSVDTQAIAAQIWFVAYGKASIYRLVYDPDWKQYSPGSILTEYLMRYVIETDNVSEIDFLTGNEHYKQDWMTVRKERLGFRFAKQQAVNKNSMSRIIQFLRK